MRWTQDATAGDSPLAGVREGSGTEGAPCDSLVKLALCEGTVPNQCALPGYQAARCSSKDQCLPVPVPKPVEAILPVGE